MNIHYNNPVDYNVVLQHFEEQFQGRMLLMDPVW